MNYYIEETYYPTVKELLKLPIFSTSYLAAGESGLNRTVSGINLSDNPDYGQWISPGELMISTCFSVYQDPDAMNAYIPTLVQNQMAAFCIKPSAHCTSARHAVFPYYPGTFRRTDPSPDCAFAKYPFCKPDADPDHHRGSQSR